MHHKSISVPECSMTVTRPTGDRKYEHSISTYLMTTTVRATTWQNKDGEMAVIYQCHTVYLLQPDSQGMATKTARELSYVHTICTCSVNRTVYWTSVWHVYIWRMTCLLGCLRKPVSFLLQNV